MKVLVLAGILALGCAAPAFAQTPAEPPAAHPAAPATPPVASLAASEATPLDTLVEEATAPEDRARLLLRCAGPPPRLTADKSADKPKAAPPLPPARDPLG
jgi:hypothetical protein